MSLAPVIKLSALGRGIEATVVGVEAPEGLHPAAEPALLLRLIEIGFVAGEPVRVTAFGHPGRDPLGVRVGGRGGSSTFALRRYEAAHVLVRPLEPCA